jgi:hypothetical protein
MRKIDNLSPEQRKSLAAEIETFLQSTAADSARLDAVSAELHADLEAAQRRHEAYELAKRLGELRGGQFTFEQDSQWRHAFERLLATETKKETNNDQ